MTTCQSNQCLLSLILVLHSILSQYKGNAISFSRHVHRHEKSKSNIPVMFLVIIPDMSTVMIPDMDQSCPCYVSFIVQEWVMSVSCPCHGPYHVPDHLLPVSVPIMSLIICLINVPVIVPVMSMSCYSGLSSKVLSHHVPVMSLSCPCHSPCIGDVMIPFLLKSC